MRLFVGLKLPPQALSGVEKASAPLQGALGVKMTEPQNLHITLKFIGDVDEEAAKKIEVALEAVKFRAFEVILSGTGAFPNVNFPRAIWIGGKSEGAKELASKIESALSFLGLKREEFSVHLTVARAPKSVADIDDFLKQTGEVCSFEAGSFFLVRSRLTPAGPIYEDIKEYAANQ